VTVRRRLIVVRHAKAEPFAASDHARALTERGHADARDVGTFLRESELLPDHAVVSSAVRTRQTWDDLAETAGAADCPVTFEDAVHTGSPDRVLEALRAVPPAARTVLLVGHNPTAAYLCHFLDDGGGDPSATSGMLRGFAPASACVLEIEVPWTDLGAETGRVLDFRAGRD
jgi:phosphohistidine phosphatase